jgi:hypothetical protein
VAEQSGFTSLEELEEMFTDDSVFTSAGKKALNVWMQAKKE